MNILDHSTHLDLLHNQVPLCILMTLIILLIVLGNCFVIMAVCLERRLRKQHCNCYLISLAIADLLIGCLVIPISAWYELNQIWPLNDMLCRIWLATDMASCSASIFNLCAISLDRWCAIASPMRYRQLSTRTRAWRIIFVLWCLAICISTPVALGWGASPMTEHNRQCSLNTTSDLPFTLYSSTLSFFLPLMVMTFFYTRIYMIATRHRSNIKRGIIWNSSTDLYLPGPRPRSSTITNQLKRLTAHTKAAKTLGIIIGAFVICWGPFFTVHLLSGICAEACRTPENLTKVFFWLGYCNSWLNPLIYPCLSRDFRTAFVNIARCRYSPILCCCWGLSRSSHITSGQRRTERMKIHRPTISAAAAATLPRHYGSSRAPLLANPSTDSSSRKLSDSGRSTFSYRSSYRKASPSRYSSFIRRESQFNCPIDDSYLTIGSGGGGGGLFGDPNSPRSHRYSTRGSISPRHLSFRSVSSRTTCSSSTTINTVDTHKSRPPSPPIVTSLSPHGSIRKRRASAFFQKIEVRLFNHRKHTSANSSEDQELELTDSSNKSNIECKNRRKSFAGGFGRKSSKKPFYNQRRASEIFLSQNKSSKNNNLKMDEEDDDEFDDSSIERSSERSINDGINPQENRKVPIHDEHSIYTIEETSRRGSCSSQGSKSVHSSKVSFPSPVLRHRSQSLAVPNSSLTSYMRSNSGSYNIKPITEIGNSNCRDIGTQTIESSFN